MAVIYTNDEWGVGFLNEFKNKFTSLGGAIVQEESFNKGDRDLKIQLIKIKNINPEMVLFLGVEAETILGFKQMKELNINMPVLGGASWSNLTIWKELKEIGDGSLYVKARPISNDEFNKNTKVNLAPRKSLFVLWKRMIRCMFSRKPLLIVTLLTKKKL